MTRIQGNEPVKAGHYFNPRRLAVASVARDGERLPDGEGAWVRIPAVAALLVTPLLGALFLVFLPFIGFAVAGEAAGSRLVEASSGSARALASTVTPGWVPGEAHLTGKSAPRRARREEPSPVDLRLAALEAEIARRRGC